GPYSPRSAAATRGPEPATRRKFRRFLAGPATFRVLTGLLGHYGNQLRRRNSYERGFAYRLDEGTHRLRPIGRARPHQPSDGFVDAGLSDSGTAHGPRARSGARRFQAGGHSRLEHARRARLSAPRTGSG